MGNLVAQILRFNFLRLSGSDTPDGLQQDFEATLGDSDGYGSCYRFGVSDTLKNLRCDIQILTLTRALKLYVMAGG